MLTLAAALESRSYPGRGLIAARTQAGARCLVYFLTGRSPSSRARRLAVLDPGDVAVQGAEPGARFDPLRHYVAAARRGSWVIVGNGAQVVPIAESLAGGGDPLTAWRQHSYEPDAPIFTPRIWVATIAATTEFLIGYALRSGRAGRAGRGDGDGGGGDRDDGTDRVVWAVDDLPPGRGVLMSTYDGTPERVHNARVPVDFETASATAGELLDEVFSALAPDLRVAAFALDPDRADAGIEARP